MPKTCYKIRGGCYDCSVRLLASTLVSRCCPGRLDCVIPTASGRSIGMARWQKRLRFNRIARHITQYPKTYAKFTSVAAIATKSCINTDCYERKGPNERQEFRIVPAFLGS